MMIDFNQVLKDINNNPIPKEGSSEPLFLKDVCVNALVQNWKDDRPDGNLKLKFWELACKIRDSVIAMEISVEDVATLKDRIAKFYATTVCGQAYQIFESVGCPRNPGQPGTSN